LSTGATSPGRRFLHVCYCCAETTDATPLFVDGLAMRCTMSSPTSSQSGSTLGLDGDVVSGADFVYDARGPRISPAIEVQAWVDPPVVGTPYHDPTAVGVHALGFSVPDLGAAVGRLQELGCTALGAGTSPFDTQWVSVRDGTGVTIDLVDDAAVPAGETRMRHLRITVSDLAASLTWYEGLGFSLVDRGTIDDASFLGLDGKVRADVARLRLPDEPYEVLLVQWHEPRSHGRHYRQANHAGLYRAAIGVDDTRASYEAMSSEGWIFDRAPASIELTGTPVPDMWICFLSDPDGITYELVERPRSVFRPER
jgi:catechol 2,3-dioxygenase-like lactoylglutathione lyase family enzyme